MPERLAIASLLRKLVGHAESRHLVLSVLVGLIAGAGAIAFYFATNFVDHGLLTHLAGYHIPGEGVGTSPATLPMITSLAMEHRWFLFLLPAARGPDLRISGLQFRPRGRGTRHRCGRSTPSITGAA